MARILTVLRSGGEYTAEHVERLRAQCAEHAPGVEFCCLSDVPVPGRIALGHDWPGWWSKIEAFRITGPVLYMDLDTTVRGDLTPLLEVVESSDFTVLRDFNFPAREVQSSIMGWSGDMGHLYETFRADPVRHMHRNASGRWWGDQGFIERHVAARGYWQDRLPGTLVSFKKHCQGGIPAGARVVVFHGKPRPWEVE